jgi:hypothetical protein
MNVFYDVYQLPTAAKRALCYRAHTLCDSCRVDILLASEVHREFTSMDFYEAMRKFDSKCHFTMIHRQNQNDDVLEVAFSTMHCPGPNWYLWIFCAPEHIPELTEGLRVMT